MFLEIRNIKKSFGTGDSKVDVLKGLDLDIEKGEFCVLLGPSGSGKSTLLNIIGGIESADGGSISIEGEKLADMKEKKLSQYRRKHLGYIRCEMTPTSVGGEQQNYISGGIQSPI